VAAGIAISALDTAVALMACLTMFPVLFSAGLPAQAGPGMVFVSMPTAFSQMPGGTVLGVLFFVLLLFAALTSAVSLLEIAVATLIDMFGVRRRTATLGAGLAIFLFGLMSADAGFKPFPAWLVGERNFFDTVDWLVSNIMLPIGGLVLAVFVGWVMPSSQSREQFTTGSRLGGLYGGWLFLLRYVVPAGIVLILLHSTGIF
jgi:NSS family neurotransmitter:Na+ symporter